MGSHRAQLEHFRRIRRTVRIVFDNGRALIREDGNGQTKSSQRKKCDSLRSIFRQVNNTLFGFHPTPHDAFSLFFSQIQRETFVRQ